MRLLLDSHALVWAAVSPKRLSTTALEAIRSSGSELFVSSATVWELATKYRIGKLPQAKPILDALDSLMEDLVARHLAMTHVHAKLAGLMPVEHRDPFDRMLAAQALVEDLRLVTRDPAFAAFDVNVVW